MKPLTRDQIAQRAARDIPDGAFVNLGIGLPVLVANHLPTDRELWFQSENGVLGVGPSPLPGEEDPDLINASKKPITLALGGSYFNHDLSFVMIRGGHIDLALLGAFQVSADGDLANYATPDDDGPAVGGAMDLAVGAKSIWVLMEHTTKDGEPRIVERCTYPLTARRVVRRLYTSHAVIDVTPRGLQVREILSGIAQAELQKITGAPLRF